MPPKNSGFDVSSMMAASEDIVVTQPASVESLETRFEKNEGQNSTAAKKKSPDDTGRYRLCRHGYCVHNASHDPHATAFAHYLCRFSNQILGVDDDIVDLLSVKPQNMPTTTTAAANKHWRVKRCRCGSTTHKRSNHMSVDTRHFLSAQNC